MAVGDAVTPERAIVYIGAASLTPSLLGSSATAVTAEITNFSESGGEEDFESVPVFGGGNIDKTKPRTQIEVSFDVIIRYASTAATELKWDAYKWGAVSGSTVSSSTDAGNNCIFVQFTDGTYYYTRGYNNAKGYTFEPTAAADDFLSGTITFKLSPTTAAGNPNLRIANIQASTFTAWGA